MNQQCTLIGGIQQQQSVKNKGECTTTIKEQKQEFLKTFYFCFIFAICTNVIK